MQRFVKTLRLKPDPELIKGYIEAHDAIWPVIRDGLRQAGIGSMEIYLLGSLAVMIVEMPDGLDHDEAFSRLSALPGQQEWEEFVSRFQECGEGDSSAQKWQPMSKIFSLG